MTSFAPSRVGHGFVTLPGSGQEWATANSISRLGDRSLPVHHRFGSELPQGRSGDEMALQVEGKTRGSSPRHRKRWSSKPPLPRSYRFAGRSRPGVRGDAWSGSNILQFERRMFLATSGGWADRRRTRRSAPSWCRRRCDDPRRPAFGNRGRTDTLLGWRGFAVDSPLEEAGFEPLVPRHAVKVSRAAHVASA